MSVKITIRPSGHTFDAEPSETLLESAFRNGISLNYNCNNGSCGKCAARLVSGEIASVLPHDHVFKHHEKAQNSILLCRAKPLTDLVIYAKEPHSADEIPKQSIDTIVHKIEQINDDICIIQLRTSRSRTLQFLAGQHVSLSIGGIRSRNKSIASCPCNGMYLQFHIREHPGDEFSEFIFKHLKARQRVTVTGPYGKFLLKEDSCNPIIFIAFDIGFAPIKSLIEHTIALDKSQPIYLYWLIDDSYSHYQGNYCRSWEDALDNFHYRPMKINYQDDLLVDLNRLQRLLTNAAEVIVDEHESLHNYDIYINGPSWLYSGMLEVFKKTHIADEQIMVDTMKRY